MLFDSGDTAVGRCRILAELRRIVAGNDAIRRVAGKLDHAHLVLDIGRLISFSKRGAGAMLGQIAIEINIVGGKHKGRIAINPQVLGGVCVMASGVGLNVRTNLDVVTVDEAHPAFSVELHEFLNVGGVNAAMIAAGLPGLAGVVAKLLFLNPDRCFGKKVDAAEMVPVRVADDDVGDLVRLEASEFHCFVGANVFRRWKVFQERVAVIAAVK